MEKEENKNKPVGPYFNDPRLSMTIVGRLLVRSLAFLTYACLSVLCVVGLFSDGVPSFRWAGIFLALFLIDRFKHLKKSRRSFLEMPVGGRVNLATYADPAALRALEKSFEDSMVTRSSFTLQIVKQFLKSEGSVQIMSRFDIKFEEFRQKLEEFLDKSGNAKDFTREKLMGEAGAVIDEAFRQALSAHHVSIEFGDVCVAAALSKDAGTSQLLEAFTLTPNDLSRGFLFAEARRRAKPARHGRVKIRHAIMNRAWTSRPTPALDRYSHDLTDLARLGMLGFMLGHADDYGRLVTALSRPVNPNVLLVGADGIGKETLVEHLAISVVLDRVPDTLSDRRVVRLDIAEVVTDSHREEFSGLIRTIADEITIAGNVILYIPDFHLIARGGSGAYLTAADALLPIIKNNLFPVIGATYPKEFISDIEPRSDITAVFEVIHVQELAEAEAQELCIYEAAVLEKGGRAIISFGAIRETVALAKRYLRTKPLPSSAIELLKEAYGEAEQAKLKMVGPREIEKLVEAKVHIPVHGVDSKEAEKLLHMEETIHLRYIDQEEAVKAVSQAIREYRSGLARTTGPIATFLFVGPTGVGKTELAKNLARIHFGSEGAIIRFDMTEYQDKQSFERFIGSPDHAVSGMLTEAVFQKPYSLILLDEFEKAYPDILNLFLQVFDDGRLTDNLGRVIDFQNTIIIATSNAHSDILAEALRGGESVSQIAEYFKTKLTDIFRPELVNRFSKIVVFKNLSPNDVLAIARLNLAELSKQLASQGVNVEWDEEAVKLVAHQGFDPVFGARPLRQVISEKLRAPLSELILKKELKHGSRAVARVRDGAIVFENESGQ
jgi:ATP-dependent Clp protease ATP-binding subunit ClpC